MPKPSLKSPEIAAREAYERIASLPRDGTLQPWGQLSSGLRELLTATATEAAEAAAREQAISQFHREAIHFLASLRCTVPDTADGRRLVDLAELVIGGAVAIAGGRAMPAELTPPSDTAL